MRIAIVQFPGSNCERETILAVQRAGMEPVEFLWNEYKNPPCPPFSKGDRKSISSFPDASSSFPDASPPLKKGGEGQKLRLDSHCLDAFPPLKKGGEGGFSKLEHFDGYIIVGGFSYEDRSRSGAIAALDPIMQVIRQQSELGKPVLGICNGAQILVETGLVPGLENHKIGMALTENKRMRDGQVLGTGFYNAWVHMRLADEYQYNAFTRFLTPETILHIPVAHGEGRFVIPPALLAEMKSQGLGVFQYCDATGRIIDAFPVNPNGSIDNIAAVSNKAGNVMAMMPHPERTPNGDAIFQSMREYIAKGYVERTAPLHYLPRPYQLTSYHKPTTTRELIVELMITDNHAMSVENALHHRDIPVKITRQMHWEIDCDPDVYEKILQSGVLYNDRKELVCKHPPENKRKTYLVRAKDDILAQQKKQMLQNHFGIDGIRSIRHGVLWSVMNQDNVAHFAEQVINTHILFNPYSHDCYYY
jgi:phosphoribosylformylglycinamidine synthase